MRLVDINAIPTMYELYSIILLVSNTLTVSKQQKLTILPCDNYQSCHTMQSLALTLQTSIHMHLHCFLQQEYVPPMYCIITNDVASCYFADRFLYNIFIEFILQFPRLPSGRVVNLTFCCLLFWLSATICVLVVCVAVLAEYDWKSYFFCHCYRSFWYIYICSFNLCVCYTTTIVTMQYNCNWAIGSWRNVGVIWADEVLTNCA